MPAGKKAKYRSSEVTRHSQSLDLEEGVLTWKDPKRMAQPLFLSQLGPPSDMLDQTDDEEDQKEKEQHLRNSCGRKGNRAEAEQARYNRDDQENQSPIKHLAPPLVCA